jgi:hypothetical protein
MSKGILKTALLAWLLFSVASAHANQAYTFTQSGFAEGAVISGSFSGNDLNHDGLIQGPVSILAACLKLRCFHWLGPETQTSPLSASR